MARKYSTSKSSRYTKKGRKTSTGPRRSVKKSKPTGKKFSMRQMREYITAVEAKRSGDGEE